MKAVDEQKVLEALAKLNKTVERGFSGMNKRFEAIESRLGRQEKKAQRTARQQRLQAAEIDELKRIVRRLAKQAPVRTYDDASAIRKEGAYQAFEECGIDKVAAMKALQECGAIRRGHQGRNTDTIWLDGKCQRVIIVITKE